MLEKGNCFGNLKLYVQHRLLFHPTNDHHNKKCFRVLFCNNISNPDPKSDCDGHMFPDFT